MEYSPKHSGTPTIFVSRRLAPSSPLSGLCHSHCLDVRGYSLIGFEGVPFDAPPPHDLQFFYSRNAVRFFHAQQGGSLHAVPSACMGEGTASALREWGLEPVFVGNGDPVSVAAAFASFAEGKRVLFPRARHSRQSIQKSLPPSTIALDLVVYDNYKLTDFPNPQADILVFTSPLNAEAYFDLLPLQAGQRVVAIGNTTAAALRRLGVQELRIAKQPSEQALAEAVLALLNV